MLTFKVKKNRGIRTWPFSRTFYSTKQIRMAVCFQEQCEVDFQDVLFDKSSLVKLKTRPAWAGFKTAEEGIAIIKSYIL